MKVIPTKRMVSPNVEFKKQGHGQIAINKFSSKHLKSNGCWIHEKQNMFSKMRKVLYSIAIAILVLTVFSKVL